MTRKTKNEPRFSRNALLYSELFRTSVTSSVR